MSRGGQPSSRRDLVAEALAASELRYRRLFETAKDGILILDAETGMVVDVNPFLVQLLGYSYEQFVGKAIWDLGFFRDVVANQDKFIDLQQQEYVRYENLPLETALGHGETILLVEDERSLRVMLSRFLSSLEYTVLAAESLEVALRLEEAHAGEVRLLMTDVVLPGMDGRQLATKMLTRRPGIMVLFMSGYPADVIAQRGVLEENTAFLAKPFLRTDLAFKLREVLGDSATPTPKPPTA